MSDKYAIAVEHIRALILAFDDHVSLPEPDCSCIFAPPCGDCVENSFAREALSDARAFLAAEEAAS